MARPPKVAIVGCGNISQFHLKGYAAAGATVVGLVDPDKTKGQAMAEQFAGQWFKSVGDLLRSAQLDAASVTVPNFLHREVCGELMEAGVAVLCEKTLASNALDSRALLETAGKHPEKFQMGFMKRFHPSAKKFVQFVSRIGTIEGGHLKCFQPMGRWPQKHWLFTKDKGGGGILLHGGSHTLDLLNWAMGTAPVAVDARVRKAKGAEVEHYAAGLLEFRDGVTVTFEAGWLPHTANGTLGSGWEESITLRGNLGIAEIHLPTWHLSASMPVVARLYLENSKRWAEFAPAPFDYFTEQVRQFVRGVKAGKPLWPSVLDGHLVDLTVHAAYESARTKGAVLLQQSRSNTRSRKGAAR